MAAVADTEADVAVTAAGGESLGGVNDGGADAVGLPLGGPAGQGVDPRAVRPAFGNFGIRATDGGRSQRRT
ncbi:hypothetical protein ACWT_5994 [Actinoplanes sp. SE50]|uniref:hypothetical protein n=1 Tax=unclassified Actinoplanes TaxID=2626549 RepID=UPI00023EC355|nr:MULTISPECIES: hypothetical protein [unclassified Actinoplanes]AEV87011.1 hypothetical protein ACPL_6126 [Actinoplanes sp. SE50/110]ATO85409.1 hypothetical protein ACWT_5994 [Actinoplanes sp. SE50]SLM02821.1 hypothetical protein ACSP50_6106 [Actinoplanes sp. SE50/110]